MAFSEDKTFRDFAFFSAILGGKCLIMGFLVALKGHGAKIFPAAEDYGSVGEPKKPDENVVADIERIRNAHRNDMENIYPFFSLGFIYCCCNPDAATALWLFRIFTAARISHTVVYLNKVRQPLRAICYAVGQIVNFTLCGLIVKETLRF